MSDQSTPEKSSARPLSRYEFLRLLGLGGLSGALAAAGVAYRPLGSFIDWAAANGWISEGHPAQRSATFERLMQTIILDPTDYDKRTLLFSWIKFNGAELYAQATGLPLTERTLRHFLYGHGEAIDVSQDFEKAILDPTDKWMLPSAFRTMPNMVGKMIDFTLNYRQNLANDPQEPFKLSVDRDQYFRALAGNKPIHFKATMVTVADMDVIDLRNSLNQFTLYVEGDQINAEKKPGILEDSPEFYEVTLAHPKIALYDHYDWQAGTEFGGSGDIRTFINAFLRRLGVENPNDFINRLVGEDLSQRLFLNKVKIMDEEGANLTRQGFGNEFDIRGRLNVGEELKFQISLPTLEKAFKQ
ncbi:hypothetical protein HY612_03020 [Candidatus Roizmanbacteria bacterium]|nr:hypothetical protein [Candidatus Roizmanbacteria bacterium]